MNEALTALAEALGQDENVSEKTRAAANMVLEAARAESAELDAYAGALSRR